MEVVRFSEGSVSERFHCGELRFILSIIILYSRPAVMKPFVHTSSDVTAAS